MSLPVVLRLEAARDAEDTRDYLDEQRVGQGQAFLDRLNETLIRISAMPTMYGLVLRTVRAARLRKFKYVVYYRVHDDRIEVLSVLHGSRDVAEIRRRNQAP